jgi:signal transduction histidine kinase
VKISNLKILHRLSGGFILVLLLTLIVGIVSMAKMETLADMTVNMYRHPLTVSNAVRDIRADIVAMSRLMKDLILAGDARDIESVMIEMNEYEKAVIRNFDIVFERFLGDQSDVKAAYQAFSEWKAIRDEEFHLMRQGEFEIAKEMSIRKASEHLNETNRAIKVMTDFASNKADSFFENTQQVKKETSLTMIILITVIFFTGAAAALIITQSITKPVAHLIRLASDIAKGLPVEKQPVERLDEIGVLIQSFNEIIDSSNKTIAQARAISLGDYSAEIEPRSDQDELGIALRKMTKSLSRASAESERQNWIKTGQNELNENVRGNQNVSSLARNVIVYLSRYLNAQIGALYIMNEENKLQLTGSYAFTKRKGFSHLIEPGEGLTGQAAAEKEMISVTEVPDDYIRISSAFGNAVPKNIVVSPLVYEDKVKGVIELGAFREFSDTELNFLGIVTENIAVSLNSAQARAKMEILLDQTRKQAEELQIRQEELKAANEELLEQTQALKRSEEELRQQQEELETTNEELEEKTRSLEEQRTEIRRRNEELETARQHIEQKAKELEITSKYKSEFLANMSHELRTPLNSILILSRNLTDNSAGNLTRDQVECADIIYKSGNDLLELINEILDLSKIEAGKMNIHIETVSLGSVADSVSLSFKHLIETKGLRLNIELDNTVPVSVETDQQRLEQILRNFMSNAVKFTEEGGITVDIRYPEPGTDLSRSGLDPQQAIAISVSDTGIGIPQRQAVGNL